MSTKSQSEYGLDEVETLREEVNESQRYIEQLKRERDVASAKLRKVAERVRDRCEGVCTACCENCCEDRVSIVDIDAILKELE
jgi:hypothetical protein